MSAWEDKTEEEKLSSIREHLHHSHRLNLTEARWLVGELLKAQATLSTAKETRP